MKAKEYFKRYGERLQNLETLDAAITDLAKDFLKETEFLIEQRKNNLAAIILEEQNNKWNALASMLPDVLSQDGFKTLVQTLTKMVVMRDES